MSIIFASCDVRRDWIKQLATELNVDIVSFGRPCSYLAAHSIIGDAIADCARSNSNSFIESFDKSVSLVNANKIDPFFVCANSAQLHDCSGRYDPNQYRDGNYVATVATVATVAAPVSPPVAASNSQVSNSSIIAAVNSSSVVAVSGAGAVLVDIPASSFPPLSADNVANMFYSNVLSGHSRFHSLASASFLQVMMLTKEHATLFSSSHVYCQLAIRARQLQLCLFLSQNTSLLPSGSPLSSYMSKHKLQTLKTQITNLVSKLPIPVGHALQSITNASAPIASSANKRKFISNANSNPAKVAKLSS